MKFRILLPGTLAAAAALLSARAASAQPVFYYGGRVISNVEIVEVSWTSGVDPAYLTKLGDFYKTIVKSSFMDWLSEYDTIGKVGLVDNMPGSNQHIGRGTFGGSFVITPANSKKALLDAEVSAELAAQIKGGSLPPPALDKDGNVNTIYMIDFPAGYDINIMNLHACQAYGAYHFTMMYNGLSVPYGIHPTCGGGFNQATVVHSHELAEAITDMEVGLANQLSPTVRPIGWVTKAKTAWDSLETGDICTGSSDFIDGYLVQGIWSNFANGCVTHIPICDGVAMPPKCRPCNTYDSGNACSGAKPACATAGASQGQCVTCTSAYPAACTGATPVCDDATYTCVACVTNADCKTPSAPVCDAATKSCRPCQADTECSKGVCDVQGDAEHGQCVACNADKDCAANERCDNHTCAPVPPASGSGSGGAGGGGGVGGGENPGVKEIGGCGCKAAPAGDGARGGWLLAGLLALGSARRRRRSAG